MDFVIKSKNISKSISEDSPVFIIAEMSANHNQSYNNALKIIDAAAEAGVDAIKLQTYTADTITIDADNDYFKIKDNKLWGGKTLHQLYDEAYTPWDWQPKLKEYGESKGLIVFSSPFDPTAVDFLEQLAVDLYKVASFEVVDIPLLERIGQTKKPVIMSRGMASIEEINLAIETLKSNGCPEIALLHCVSAYPAEPSEMNLLTIPDMKDKFRVVVGLSDHTIGKDVVAAAIPLGAKIIEKHLTLSRVDGGPDSAFSLEPGEFKDLVKTIRGIEDALGKPSYGVGINESANVAYRKSLFIVKDIKAGEVITKNNVRSIRPGHGLEPKYYREVLGKKAIKDLSKGTPLSWDLIN